mmetsp:Transcript_14278/g.29326  ORF Transcript_14278/g.29326 Transcript_14278/m.29326 type:complete len:244 (-) Transcript_14278:35-766(-)
MVALLRTLKSVTVAVGILPCGPLIVPPHPLISGVEALIPFCVFTPVIIVEVLVHAEPPILLRVGNSSLGVLGDGVRGSILRITGDTVTGRSNIDGAAEALLSNLGPAGAVRLRTPLGIAPRPEVVDLRISRVLTHVLDDDLAVHLTVGTAAVLVGPLDGEDGTLIVVHLLVLRCAPSTESCHTVLILECLISYRTRTSVTAGGIILGVKQTVSVVTVCIAFTITVIGSPRVMHVNIGTNQCKN